MNLPLRTFLLIAFCLATPTRIIISACNVYYEALRPTPKETAQTSPYQKSPVILSGASRNASPREAQSKDPDAARTPDTLRPFLQQARPLFTNSSFHALLLTLNNMTERLPIPSTQSSQKSSKEALTHTPWVGIIAPNEGETPTVTNEGTNV